MSKNNSTFLEGCKDSVTATEILNWYRNLYRRESDGTEQYIVAKALDDMFTEYVKLKLENETLKLKLDSFTNIVRKYVKVVKTPVRREFAAYIRKAINDYSKDYESLLGDIDKFILELEEADEIG